MTAQQSAELRPTPLHQVHIDSKARMVDYAGWSMPVLYTSILEEARAVRSTAGIFDISHMGRVRIRGSGATALLQQLTSNDVESLAPSEAQYSLLTNPAGGIIDDIIVYREAPDAYLVVINASNTAKDLEWIGSHLPSSAVLTDETSQTAMLAVQGPQAPALVARIAGNEALLSLKRFQFTTARRGGAEAVFCRTGYTGEDGFEIIVSADAAPEIWGHLTANGAVACGLGARDALRIEAGYPLYGHEIDETTSPVEAGVMWVVSLDKTPFTGVDAIRAIREAGPSRRLVGLRCDGRQQPRQGYDILVGDVPVGVITSGVFSPTRSQSIAMGYIGTQFARAGTAVAVAVRESLVPAKVCAKKSLLSADS